MITVVGGPAIVYGTGDLQTPSAEGTLLVGMKLVLSNGMPVFRCTIHDAGDSFLFQNFQFAYDHFDEEPVLRKLIDHAINLLETIPANSGLSFTNDYA